MARRNGWQAPYAIQFIALNVIFYLSALAFFGYFQFLIDPSLLDPLSPPVLPWGPMRIAILTITIISLLMSYSASLYASIKNPADPAILRKHHNSTSTDSESCSKFCEICDCAVHDGTMHCKYCDKCILRLDHHCFYLNTCIGRRNYSAYLISIGTGCVYFACISICGWFSFAAYFTNRQRLIDIASQVFGSIGDGIALALTIMTAIISLLCSLVFFFLLNLVLLHIVLGFKGMSTLEYSRMLRRQAQEKKARQLIRQSQITPRSPPTVPLPSTNFIRRLFGGGGAVNSKVHPAIAKSPTVGIDESHAAAEENLASPRLASPPTRGDDSKELVTSVKQQ